MKPANPSTTDTLAAKLAAGAATGFRELYNQYWPLLFRHAYKMLRDEEEAMDVVQEVFITVWEKRETLTIQGSLSSFLYSCVRNRVLDRMARDKVHAKYLSSLADYYEQGVLHTDEAYRMKELAQLIEKEIDALPAKMQTIFRLSREEACSYQHIADQLGVSDHTVRKQISNALRILRVKLSTMLMMLF